MHRFFVEPKQVLDNEIIIEGSDVKHITRVLRLGIGDKIEIADGKNREYVCTVSSIDQDSVTVTINTIRESLSEPPISVFLYQGISKGDKMDYTIQKSTEIGVDEFIPIQTERSVVQLTGSKATKRQERWQRIAEEAAKQSGRGRIPVVHEVVDFETAVNSLPQEAVVLFPWEGEQVVGLREILSPRTSEESTEVRKVAVFIGPEGGFAHAEVEKARKAGAIPVSLGPRILRTETAGPLVASLVLYEWGDLGISPNVKQQTSLGKEAREQ